MDNLDPFSGPEFKADSLETAERLRRFALEMADIGWRARFQLARKKSGVEGSNFSIDHEFHEDPLSIIERLSEALLTTAGTLDMVARTLPDVREAVKLRTAAALRRERKMALARAGASGLQSRHSKARELKAWAAQQAKTMKGADLDIARRLAAQIPEHLADASNNPERLIYDHLRAQRNTAS